MRLIGMHTYNYSYREFKRAVLENLRENHVHFNLDNYKFYWSLQANLELNLSNMIGESEV